MVLSGAWGRIDKELSVDWLRTGQIFDETEGF